MKIAVIGTGYWGKNHVRVLKELLDEGQIEGLCICDIDKEKVKEISFSYKIPYYINYKDLPANIDGVVIATPSDTHYKITKEFLEKGKDVLVEKPMTLKSREAETLIEIAERNSSILMVGHIFRYHPAIVELRNRINKGDFGKIYYMISNRLSLRQPRKDMGVLFALGIHEVDIFCYLLGKEYPEAIFATMESYIGETEEMAHITVYFEEGTKGYAFESWITPVYGKKRELIAVGSRMSAYVDYLKPNEIKFFESTLDDEKVSMEGFYSVPLEYKEPLKEELKDFVGCIKTRRKPIADMYVGKRAVEIIETAIKSAKVGKKTPFNKVINVKDK